MTPGIVRARKVEAHFARRLRKIASIIAEIVRAFPEGDLTGWPDLEAALARYSEAIEPWARAVCRTMHAEVDRRDLAAEVSKAIQRTGEVTKARADLISRTEVSRTAATLTQVRAEHVGSTHFIWVTSGDSDVRESHKKLNGKVFMWSDPPVCDPPNYRALPGCIWNCRCYAHVILPDT